MNLVPRAYQLAIYHSALQHGNTLVILGTGLGKTLIAFLLIREKMKEGKCLLLTPTKPLAKQHLQSIRETLGIEDAVLLTGETKAEDRKEEYRHAVIVATPQTIANDLKNGALAPDFSLAVFDEAHRAVKDYAYTKIAQALPEKTLLLGLTASPGGRRDRIEEVLGHLRITNIEIRTPSDEDVRPYIQPSPMTWVPVVLSPKLKEIQELLQQLIGKYARALSAFGFVPPLKHKGLFIQLRERILRQPSSRKYRALVFHAALLNVLHMQELIETQGAYALRKYMEKVRGKGTKSAAMILREEEFAKIEGLSQQEEEHPKLQALIELLRKMQGKKSIVFAQYRDQIALLEQELNKAGFRAKQFMGRKKEYTRAMQEETIRQFREGAFDILVSTSIGEEGLDIPSVDAVIFYEPVPSEIRSIQRRGRAARLRQGEVYILMTKDTRDEHHHWSSNRKEKKMKQIISQLQYRLNKTRPVQGQPPREEPKPKPGQSRITSFLQ